MKKTMLILVMLLIAATSYNQTSRRSANDNATARKTVERSTQATSNRNPRTVATNTSSKATSVAPTQRNKTTVTTNTPSTRVNRTTPNTRTYENTANHRKVVSTPATRVNTANRTPRSNDQYTTSTRPNRSNNHAGYTQRKPGNTHSTAHVAPRKNSQNVVYASPRVYRESHKASHHHYQPASWEYRRTYHAYRRPAHYDICWTPHMHRHFIDIYPMVHRWDYHNGYRIEMVSAYDAMYYRGDVMTVYGKVKEVYYSHQTDEYFLYFGAYYPHHDFTVVMPGYLARQYSFRAERYFLNRHMAVTGLITSFNGEPEVVVKKSFQINMY